MNKDTRNIEALTSYSSKRWSSSLRNTAKIWQAGRATSAATSFFEPITIPVGSNQLTFIDGALDANNPIYEMWTEATDVFCEELPLKKRLKCLVSIGTGADTVQGVGDSLSELAQTLKDIATETEATAQKFARNNRELLSRKNPKYFRFNVGHGLEHVGLEEASKKALILAATNRYLAMEENVQNLTACGEILKTRECMYNFS